MVSVGGIAVAQSCAAHAVIIRVVATIARTIKTNASLSGFSFGAMSSPRCQIDVAHWSHLAGWKHKRCDICHNFKFYFLNLLWNNELGEVFQTSRLAGRGRLAVTGR